MFSGPVHMYMYHVLLDNTRGSEMEVGQICPKLQSQLFLFKGCSRSAYLPMGENSMAPDITPVSIEVKR